MGWIVVLAHNVHEQHAICLEHGDLMHVDQHASDGHDHSLAESTEHHTTLDALPGHDDHDHCALGPFVRKNDFIAATQAPLEIEPAVELFDDERRTLTEANRPPPVELLHLAPKTSPPHHA